MGHNRAMHDLLQELDPEFYREARLRMVRAEIDYLVRERAARERAARETRAKIPLATERELPGACPTR